MVVQYPDISHFQSGLVLRGAPLVFAKASQGVSYADPAYAGFKLQAQRLGAPFGAYHWLDTSDAVAQARHAYSVIGPGVPAMVDDEQPRISVPHTLAFVAEFRRLGGLVRLEYLPRWVWEQSGMPDLRPLAGAGLALVASDYSPDGPVNMQSHGWQPYGGVRPTILQFTDRHWFNGMAVDFNQYQGALSDLLALLFGSGTPPTPVPANAVEDPMYLDLDIGETHVVTNPAAVYGSGHSAFYAAADFGDGSVRVALWDIGTKSWSSVRTVAVNRVDGPALLVDAPASILKMSIMRVPQTGVDPQTDPAKVGLTVTHLVA